MGVGELSFDLIKPKLNGLAVPPLAEQGDSLRAQKNQVSCVARRWQHNVQGCVTSHFTDAFYITERKMDGAMHRHILDENLRANVVILHPTRQSLGTTGALLILPGIWASALFLAMPQFLFRVLSHHVINLPGVEAVNFCFEDWPVEHGRAYYSVFVMLVQFFVPLLTVTVSYAMIVHKLKSRVLSSSVRGSHNLRKDESRNRKTNVLLMTIAIIFCLSWLPLNLYNIIVDFTNPFGEDTDTMLTVYAICHLLGMSSACSNPILYGWLNDNFRKEFKEILRVAPCCKCLSEDDPVSSPRSRILSLGPETQEELEPDEGTNFKPFEQIMMNDLNSPVNGIRRDDPAENKVVNGNESEEDKLIFRETTLS